MDTEARLRVNENGRVVIPASFRKALGINAGDEVVLRIEDDELQHHLVAGVDTQRQRRGGAANRG